MDAYKFQTSISRQACVAAIKTSFCSDCCDRSRTWKIKLGWRSEIEVLQLERPNHTSKIVQVRRILHFRHGMLSAHHGDCKILGRSSPTTFHQRKLKFILFIYQNSLLNVIIQHHFVRLQSVMQFAQSHMQLVDVNFHVS